MKKSRVTCKRFINMQCYIDTEHLDCAKCEKFEPLDHIADDSKKVEDAVNHPNHYNQGGIECIDCIKAALGENFIGFLIGNVIKYAYRYKHKNGVEDLRKCKWYLEKAIEEVQKDAADRR